VNPGSPVEEGGETARALISTMKESPITLALVIFNILLLVLVYYNAKDLRKTNERQFKAMLDEQAKTTELLSRIALQAEKR